MVDAELLNGSQLLSAIGRFRLFWRRIRKNDEVSTSKALRSDFQWVRAVERLYRTDVMLVRCCKRCGKVEVRVSLTDR